MSTPSAGRSLVRSLVLHKSKFKIDALSNLFAIIDNQIADFQSQEMDSKQIESILHSHLSLALFQDPSKLNASNVPLKTDASDIHDNDKQVHLEYNTIDESNENIDPNEIEIRNRERTKTSIEDLIKKRNMLLIIVISVLSLLIIGGAVISILMKKDDNPHQKKSNPETVNQAEPAEEKTPEANSESDSKADPENGAVTASRNDGDSDGERRLLKDKLRTVNEILRKKNLSEENRSILNKVYSMLKSNDQREMSKEGQAPREIHRNLLTLDSLIRKTSSYEELTSGNVLRMNDSESLANDDDNRWPNHKGLLPIILI